MDAGKTDKDTDIRILLIGKPGSGRTSTGNTLIGSKSFQSSVTGTTECRMSSSNVFNQELHLAIAPDIAAGTDPANSNIDSILLECLNWLAPGPHLICFVNRIGWFTQEDKNLLDLVLSSMGKEEVLERMCVIFTGEDELEGVDIEEYVRTCTDAFQTLLSNCQHVAVNNRSDEDNKRTFVSSVISMALRNKVRNKVYTIDVYHKAKRLSHEEEEQMERGLERERKRLYRQLSQERSDTQLRNDAVFKSILSRYQPANAMYSEAIAKIRHKLQQVRFTRQPQEDEEYKLEEATGERREEPRTTFRQEMEDTLRRTGQFVYQKVRSNLFLWSKRVEEHSEGTGALPSEEEETLDWDVVDKSQVDNLIKDMLTEELDQEVPASLIPRTQSLDTPGQPDGEDRVGLDARSQSLDEERRDTEDYDDSPSIPRRRAYKKPFPRNPDSSRRRQRAIVMNQKVELS